MVFYKWFSIQIKIDFYYFGVKRCNSITMSKIDIQLLSMMSKKVSYHLIIDNEYMYIDLIRYFCDTVPHLSICALNIGRKMIDVTMLKNKVINDVKDNILVLREIGIFSPKNSFIELKNLILLFDFQLEDTVNILDVCPI